MLPVGRRNRRSLEPSQKVSQIFERSGPQEITCENKFLLYWCYVRSGERVLLGLFWEMGPKELFRYWRDLTRPKDFTQKVNSFYNSIIWHLRNNKFVCFVFWTGFRLSKFSISKLVVWLNCNLLFMRVCIVGYVTITVSHVLKHIDYLKRWIPARYLV